MDANPKEVTKIMRVPVKAFADPPVNPAADTCGLIMITNKHRRLACQT